MPPIADHSDRLLRTVRKQLAKARQRRRKEASAVAADRADPYVSARRARRAGEPLGSRRAERSGVAAVPARQSDPAESTVPWLEIATVSESHERMVFRAPAILI